MNRFHVACALSAVLSMWASNAAADDSEPAPASVPPRPVTITYTMPAAAPAADTPPEAPPPEGKPRYDLLRLSAGPRFDYIGTSGFDTFARSNLLTSFAIDATYPVLTREKLTVGVGLGWTVGHRGDGIRGMSTDLTVHRLQVPIEARYHFLPGVFGFAKIAPGAAAMVASMQESSAPTTLRGTGWGFSADASVGAGILVGPRNNLDKRTVRVWALPELGYGITTSANLGLKPDREEKDALGTDERTAVNDLALSAFFWRLSVAVTY